MKDLVYKVFYKESIEKDLKHVNKSTQKKLLDKIEKELAKNPTEIGKPLKGQYKGLWSYRVGDYRVIYRISIKEILILVLKIGHRKDIYN